MNVDELRSHALEARRLADRAKMLADNANYQCGSSIAQVELLTRALLALLELRAAVALAPEVPEPINLALRSFDRALAEIGRSRR